MEKEVNSSIDVPLTAYWQKSFRCVGGGVEGGGGEN